MARTSHKLKPPRWLKILSDYVGTFQTARDWLRIFLKLRRRMVIYELIEGVPLTEAFAVMTRAGEVGYIGGPHDRFLANLGAPDAVLKKQFDNWLAKKRREFPAPVAKRGPAALNGQFGTAQFRNWRDLRIVEYAALLVWRARLPEAKRKLVTLTVIGAWTERHGSNDRKRTFDALKDAMAKLPALAAQAGVEMSAKLD